ncbi:MAG: T9SS type A sorting domain-containing protein [Candidatus Electryonea clarkiae]|nr:T9SS type A sorting domain-containing protein [Candidatus Electryonea clarkiae]MDP8286386.1 T9SS type A sorting domain-containing protein [Candidatus Electryonea clarkiae]
MQIPIKTLNIIVSLVIVLFYADAVSGQAVKCGTIHSYNLVHNLDSPIASLRPALPLSSISASGRFEVHYTLSGADSTTSEFVDSALIYLDDIWRLEVDSLGFNPPAFEEDGRIHVYIENLSYYYGSSHPLSSSGTGVPGYIRCENDFAESVFSTHGIDALKVTLAHEFFHLIQFGYRLDPFQLGLYEWFSTWMEDIAYENVNDYIAYTDVLFENPESSLIRTNGIQEYAASVFIHLVSQGYGNDIINMIWEEFGDGGGDLFDHIFQAISMNGAENYEVAAKYMAWCYYTGERAIDGFGFLDASLYHTLEVTRLPSWSVSVSEDLGTWGFYGAVLPGPIQGNPGFTVSPEDSVAGVISVRNGNVVQYYSDRDDGTLSGDRGFAGALALDTSVRDATISVSPDNDAPFEIISIYPNPSIESVSFEVFIEDPLKFSFDIYNVLGRKVYSKEVNTLGARYSQILWNGVSQSGRRAASGLYILRVEKNGNTQCKPFVLLGRQSD